MKVTRAKRPTNTITVGSNFAQHADYYCDGVADDVQLSIAIARVSSANASITKVYIFPGQYNVNANIPVTGSNIEIELAPGAVIKAAQRTDSSFKSEYRGIFYLRNPGSGNTQTGVYIHGGTIDCNYQIETSAISIWGSGSNAQATVTTTNIRIEDMLIKSKGGTSASPALIQVHSCTDLNLGRVDNVKIRNCVITDSDRGGIKLRGSYMKNIYIEDNEISYIDLYSIDHSGGSESGSLVRTTENVYIRGNNFHDNMLVDMATTVYDFGMSSRIGIKTLIIEGNTFDGAGEFTQNDNPHLQIYCSDDVSISHNTFKDTRQALSLGYSNNATILYDDPNKSITIADNDFYRVNYILTDYDSNTRALWTDNRFFECGLDIANAYSVHSFTVFQDNLVYNCQRIVESDADFLLYSPSTNSSNYPDKYKSCITIGGSNQYIIKGNTFVDDRKLNDPTFTPSADSSLVSGGSMGARTYYYRYVFGNVSGVTMPSPSRSVSVGANQLLRIRPINDASTNYRPSTPGVTLPLNVSGVREIRLYVGTTEGQETLQAVLDYPDFTVQGTGWTEATTGLVSGDALPDSNTTHAMTKYGVYEATIEGGYLGPNNINNNYFYGIPVENCIYASAPTATRTIKRNNSYTVDLSGVSYTDEDYIYSAGDVSGAVSVNRWFGAAQKLTLVGDVVLTITDGYIIGDHLTLICTQDSSGGHGITWPGNFKKAGGALTLTATASAVDVVLMRWDGTNWLEVSRSMNCS